MPASSQKYELVFPDGHVIRFADFNESVSYIACKPFHKPLTFNGRIVDNLASWKIVVSPDKTTYRVGIHFEKETKMIPVEVVADNMPQQLKDMPTFVFPFGSYFPNPGVWKVEGTEIVKLKSPIEIKVINNKDFTVKSANYDGEKLRINLSPLFRYDTTEILNDLSSRFSHDVELTLSERKTGRSIIIFKSSLKIVFLPYNYNEVVLLIPATEYTMASRAKFSPDGKIYPYEIKDKPYCKIIVKIDTSGNSDLKSRLNKGKDVGVIEWETGKEKRKKIKSSRVTGNSIEIKALPESNISISVRLDGYKPVYETVSDYKDIRIPKIVTVSPELKLNKRIICVLKKNLSYIILGIVCFIAGFVIGRQTYATSSHEESVSQNTETDNTTNESDSISEVDKTYPLNEESEEENGSTPLSVTPKNELIIQRLKGTRFTRGDVVEAKRELRGLGQDDLIEDADACLRIINLKVNNRREKEIRSRQLFSDVIYHKDVMRQIIMSDEYLSTYSKTFRTIDEMLQYIEERKYEKKNAIDMKTRTFN